MSNTFYVDANVRNSVNVNGTNNRWTYKLPDTIELPTGTQIGLQSSIINLKGITGASIEINEEIRETICFQYYAVDTNYPTPIEAVTFATEHNLAYNLHVETTHRGNFSNSFPGETINPTDNVAENKVGYSEVLMPLAADLRFDDAGQTRTLVPLSGQAEIIIPAGVYSINKLADFITNQINLKRIPGDLQNDYISRQIDLQEYGGFPVNNTTIRNFVAEPITTFANIEAGTTASTVLTPLEVGNIGALKFTDIRTGANDGLCSIVGVTGVKNEIIKGNAQAGGFGAGNVTAGCSMAETIRSTDPNASYYIGWEKRNGYAGDPGQPTGRKLNFNPIAYNIFNSGIAFGTTQFAITFDQNNSGYTLNGLHEPRKIPSNDRFGTQLDNAGQDCIYLKQLCGATAATPSANVLSSLTNIMSRTTGILVYNWALQTAQRLGNARNTFTYQNNGLTDEQKKRCEEYSDYSRFFLTDQDARNAWETTIWYKMGFDYDDIANRDIEGSGGFNQVQYGVTQRVAGFTTNQEVDVSVIPTVSTVYNPINTKALPSGTVPTPPTAGVPLKRGALPAVSNYQMFNTFGVNIPDGEFSNNETEGSAAFFNVAPYKGSFYTGAIMIPAITTGKPFISNRLPTLSDNGYMLITSDLVESTDFLKNRQTDGLLDMIPKSSLSNQDFMADRNIITHTLSNPKSINEINIKVLNPDLTDIELEGNSTCLIRITLPMPKPTNYIADVQLEQKENQVAQAVAKQVASHTDPNVAGVNMRIDISNVFGETGSGGTGVGDQELQDAEAAYLQAGIDGALQDINPPAIPQGGLNEPGFQLEEDLEAIGVVEGLAQLQEQRGARDPQEAEQASAGVGRRQVLREPAPAGAEPAGSRDDDVEREGGVRYLKRIRIGNRQAAQARLEQMEAERARAQGRERALGRTPRQQIEIRDNIRALDRHIEDLKKVIRGFGGTPDARGERERRLEEVGQRQEQRRATGSPARRMGGAGLLRRAASEPERERFVAPARRTGGTGDSGVGTGSPQVFAEDEL